MVVATVPQTKRAAPYLRVSTDDQAEYGYSLEDQDQKCRALVMAKGWTVVGDSYVEAGVSGTVRHRPALDRLLVDIKAGKVDVVIVTKMDRLARNLKLLLELWDLIESYGATIVVIEESIDTSTPIGRLIRNVLGSIAEFERDTIAARTAAGKRIKAGRGETWRSGPMYGYRYVVGDKPAGEPGRLEIDEATAPIVRRLFTSLANGMSASQLARTLNAEGVPTVLSGRWRHATILYIINNPAYTGETTWGATETVKGKRRKTANAAVVQRIAVPALVEPELAQAAQAAVARQRTWAKRNAQRNYLLRGLLVCGQCGQRMHGSAGAYRCKPRHSVPQQAVEDAVTAKMANLLINPEQVLAEYRALADGRSQQARQAAQEIARLEHAARDLDGERERLLTLYAKGKLDEERWAARDQELAERQTALLAQAEAASAQRDAALAGVLPIDEVEAVCASYAAQVETLGPEQWQHLIRLLCVRIKAWREPGSADVSVDIEGVLPPATALTPGDGTIAAEQS
jgi:site-specific DNA recombinase